MTPEEIALEKISRLKSVPDVLVAKMQGVEQGAFKRVIEMISSLDQKDGIILNNEKNLSIINGLDSDLKDVIFNKDYFKSVADYSKQFSIQADITKDYFFTIEKNFTDSEKYKQVLEATQKSAIDLLSEDKFTEALITPLQQSLQSSIINGQSFADTVAVLLNTILGNDQIDGKLLSYVKSVAYDGFAVSDRTYTNVIAVSLGIEFYRYAGGEMKDTRCFCEERHGKYYHKKEIEDWGRGVNVGTCGAKWQGRNTGTNAATIFSFAGGYNCKHSILPVSIKSVPKADIDRAIKLGYYKLAA